MILVNERLGMKVIKICRHSSLDKDSLGLLSSPCMIKSAVTPRFKNKLMRSGWLRILLSYLASNLKIRHLLHSQSGHFLFAFFYGSF